MSQKRHTVDQVIAKLRRADVELTLLLALLGMTAVPLRARHG